MTRFQKHIAPDFELGNRCIDRLVKKTRMYRFLWEAYMRKWDQLDVALLENAQWKTKHEEALRQMRAKHTKLGLEFDYLKRDYDALLLSTGFRPLTEEQKKAWSDSPLGQEAVCITGGLPEQPGLGNWRELTPEEIKGVATPVADFMRAVEAAHKATDNSTLHFP